MAFEKSSLLDTEFMDQIYEMILPLMLARVAIWYQRLKIGQIWSQTANTYFYHSHNIEVYV